MTRCHSCQRCAPAGAPGYGRPVRPRWSIMALKHRFGLPALCRTRTREEMTMFRARPAAARMAVVALAAAAAVAAVRLDTVADPDEPALRRVSSESSGPLAAVEAAARQ